MVTFELVRKTKCSVCLVFRFNGEAVEIKRERGGETRESLKQGSRKKRGMHASWILDGA